jgi:hypothetical protein
MALAREGEPSVSEAKGPLGPAAISLAAHHGLQNTRRQAFLGSRFNSSTQDKSEIVLPVSRSLVPFLVAQFSQSDEVWLLFVEKDM